MFKDNKLRITNNNKLLQELRHIQEEIKDIDKKLDSDFEFPNFLKHQYTSCFNIRGNVQHISDFLARLIFMGGCCNEKDFQKYFSYDVVDEDTVRNFNLYLKDIGKFLINLCDMEQEKSNYIKRKEELQLKEQKIKEKLGIR